MIELQLNGKLKFKKFVQLSSDGRLKMRRVIMYVQGTPQAGWENDSWESIARESSSSMKNKFKLNQSDTQ